MSSNAARTFGSDFRQFFVRGLVVLLPTVLTLWIVVKAYQFVDSAIAQPINRGAKLALINVANYWPGLAELASFEPAEEDLMQARLDAGLTDALDTTLDGSLIPALRRQRVDAWWNAKWYMNLIGLVVAIIAVYLAGRLLGGFFGRRLYRRVERLITQLPIFKQVYPYVKQVVDFLFSDDPQMKFNRVVAVEYPRKGIWSVGFLTGPTLRSVAARAGDSVTIFVPSSPTPFTGYTITVKRADVVEIPISVEEAIRFAVSGGVLVPERELIDAAASPAGGGDRATGGGSGGRPGADDEDADPRGTGGSA